MAPTRSKGGPATLADMSATMTPVFAPTGSTAARPLPAERARSTAPASVAARASARPTRTRVVRWA